MEHATTPHHDATSFASPSAIARRVAYDAIMGNMPIARALHERARVDPPRANAFGITRTTRITNVHDYAPPPTRITRTTRANDWERNAPRDVHKPSDPSCHHPLVKCVHKW